MAIFENDNPYLGDIMKKLLSSLICIAAATAVQAQDSVTLYGVVDAATTFAKVGDGATTPGGASTVSGSRITRLDSGVGPASRLGFRGREDLGGGLSAQFVMEMGLGVDSGALQQGGLAFGRQIFVGLSGGNWSVTAGRQYSPLDIAFILSDAMSASYWANPMMASGHGTYASAGSAPGSGTFLTTGRVDNSILGTWTAGPVTAKLMVALGNETPGGAGRLVNPDIRYTSGPVSVQASYLRLRTPSGMLAAAAAPEWLTEKLVGGSYDFGTVKLFAGIYEFDLPADRTRLSAAASGSFAFVKTRSTWLGAQLPVTGGRFGVEVSRQNYEYPAGPRGRSLAAGAFYEHFLSKRTTLYASYGQVSNNGLARTPLIAAGQTIAPSGYGSDIGALSLGVRHTF